jgi:putative transposase
VANAWVILVGIEMIHMMREQQAKYARNPQLLLAQQFGILTA